MKEEDTKNLQQVLRMKGGVGDDSYALNSKIQSAYLSRTVTTLEQAVLSFCDKNLPNCVNIADLGCSSGPNTLFQVGEITSIIHKRCQELGKSLPEFFVFLNDLPGNDFNTIFKYLPEFNKRMEAKLGPNFGRCYISAVPGSFYSRLFPSNSLHFVHSGSSLHWLSQVPLELSDKKNPVINKGKVFISRTSQLAVIEAYKNQFQRDFSSFLKARSVEVVPGGRMVLMLKGRRLADPDPDESCLLWDYLGQAFQDLVSRGLIEEEKLDTYNAPYYEPYTEEIKDEIEKEGSFALDCIVPIVMPFDGCNGGKKLDRATTARNTGKAMRAVNESMIRSHFGSDIIDPLFERFEEIMAADTKEVEHVSLAVSVIRKGY